MEVGGCRWADAEGELYDTYVLSLSCRVHLVSLLPSPDANMPATASLLAHFVFARVLSSSPATPSVYLLGTIHGEQAIVHVLKTGIDLPRGAGAEGGESLASAVSEVVSFERVLDLEENDIVRSPPGSAPDPHVDESPISTAGHPHGGRPRVRTQTSN